MQQLNILQRISIEEDAFETLYKGRTASSRVFEHLIGAVASRYSGLVVQLQAMHGKLECCNDDY